MSRQAAKAADFAVAALDVERNRRPARRVAVVDGLALAVEAIVVAAIVVNILVTFGNALVRFIFEQDFPWAADIWRILISMITFLGAPAYFRRTNGMAYTALIEVLKGSRRQTLEACGLVIF